MISETIFSFIKINILFESIKIKTPIEMHTSYIKQNSCASAREFCFVIPIPAILPALQRILTFINEYAIVNIR